MPSINRTIEIHDHRRIRLNTCEGSVGISDERRIPGNRWQPAAQINLTRDEAQKLIEQLTDHMAKNF